MDKVKSFLEKYVEWVALALGAAFLGWTVYDYVLRKPVKVEAVGGMVDVAPSDIDHIVWDGPGQQIQAQIKDTSPAPSMGASVDWAAKAAEVRTTISPAVAMSLPAPYTPINKPSISDAPQIGTTGSPLIRVTQLPTAPALVDLQVSGGHSNVPDVPSPVATAPGSPPVVPGAVAPAAAIDKNWRTIEATLPVAGLAKAFADAKIPSDFSSTAILRVQLIRQERNGAGAWVGETEIAPLPINPLPPMEAIDAPLPDQKDFVEQAEKNVIPIVQPPFYTVLQGDVWYEPGTKNPNQVDATVVEDSFDFKNPGAYKGDPNLLTPDERKAYDAYHKKQDLIDARKKAALDRARARQPGVPSDSDPSQGDPNSGTGTGNGTGTGGGGGGRGRGRGRSSPMVANSQGEMIDSPLPGDPTPPMLMPPSGMPVPTPEGTPPATVSSAAALPQGSFDPSHQPDIKVWAHDATVQAGKTYRYKLRYIISSPVARTSGLCQPQTLANIAFIVSQDSVWTDPVSVESDTNFYAVSVQRMVRFDIFKWKNGIWQMQQVDVNPGDMVGSVDAATTKTDFTTGWTLVDVRAESGREDDTNTNRTILLVSDNGTLLRKELTIDQHSAEYRRLYDLANKDPSKTVSAGN